jgi:hypothetical protein
MCPSATWRYKEDESPTELKEKEKETDGEREQRADESIRVFEYSSIKEAKTDP